VPVLRHQCRYCANSAATAPPVPVLRHQCRSAPPVPVLRHHNFWLSFCEENQKQSFCFFLWNNLLIVTLKVVRKPLENWNLAMNLHWRISTSESEGKPEQKFNVAFGTILRITKSVSIYKKQAGICVSFYWNKAGQEIKNNLRMYRKYWFKFIGLEENIHLVTQTL
jgi:hypothetical protein